MNEIDNEAERFADLCDFFWRLLHPTPADDDLKHTSAESRALARQVFVILGIWTE